MAYKDFSAARAENKREPITFGLGGEDFTVPLPLPVMSFLDMLNEDIQSYLAAAGRFLRDCMGEDEYKRFSAMAKRERLDGDEISEIITFIVEEGSGLPKDQPTSLDSSSSNAEPSSTETSSETALSPS